MKYTLEDITEILHHEGYSCVISDGESITWCRQRGVVDLLHLVKERPWILRDSIIADKVVGKGAAALMILGGVREVYADVVSMPALAMFDLNNIPVTFGTRVLHIINRAGTGICPVEKLCRECATPQECLPLIERFVAEMRNKKAN